jgi:hypothetical protein
MMIAVDGWRGMNDMTNGLEPDGDDCLVFAVSDAALEAAAGNPMGAAMSFPNAPTVNILVMCCSNDDTAARKQD